MHFKQQIKENKQRVHKLSLNNKKSKPGMIGYRQGLNKEENDICSRMILEKE